MSSPTPHGVGGLKSDPYVAYCVDEASHPTRGGWIEISTAKTRRYGSSVPPHTGWVD